MFEQLELFQDTESMDFSKDEGSKKCFSCGINRPLHLMQSFWYNKNGTASISNICKICAKEQQKVVQKLKTTTPEPYDKYKCPICLKKKEELPEKRRYWVLDHDHETKKFRGWLCNTCNSALGWLNDDAELISRALSYLIKSK